MSDVVATSPPALILTLGHSSRPLADTLALLRAHAVAGVVDVRRFPRSRRHPHYDAVPLAAALAAAGITYRHAEPLGGYREPHPESPHTALTEPAFRGYADHMGSAEFARAVDGLLAEAADHRLALMCAEARPEQCHRSLLADALLARGARVEHVVDLGPREPHRLTRGVRVHAGRVSYPGSGTQLSIGGL